MVLRLGETDGIRSYWLGRLGFADALALMESIVADHAAIGDTLLLLEHDPVYTTGRGGKLEHMPGVGGRSAPGQTPTFRINRGGDVTYHGPGQLIGYPMLNLRARGGDVYLYLRSLERGLIAVLAQLGIAADIVPGRTGVWVGSRKIASIGIGVRRAITMHGFALNVSPDLQPFSAIVPCGLAGVEMTSIAIERSQAAGSEQTATPRVEEVAKLAADCLAVALGKPSGMEASL